MSILYCTSRLYEQMQLDDNDADAAAMPPDREARFGNWTATVVALRPMRLVLAVSEHADLPVVIAGEDGPSVPQRLPEGLYRLLLDLDVPADLARLERDCMQPLLLRPTAPGQANAALGQLKRHRIALRAAWERGLSRVPAELSVHLAQDVSEYLDGSTPSQAARRRLNLLPDRTEALGL